MALGNPVITVFQHTGSKNIFLVRYRDGSFDVITKSEYLEMFENVDINTKGQFPSQNKAIAYADDELVVSDTSIDLFKDMDDDDQDDYEDDDEDDEDNDIF